MEVMLVRTLAMIYAKVAQMEAMKAENQKRLSEGLSLAYGEDYFMSLSSEFENLARSLD